MPLPPLPCRREKTATAAGKQSFYSFFRGTGAGYGRRLVDSVRAVTADAALSALRTYLLPLFDVARTNCAICVNPNKVRARGASPGGAREGPSRSALLGCIAAGRRGW